MLSEFRKLSNLTQEELAVRVGISQNYYAMIEANPLKSALKLGELSKELKVTEEFLAFGDRSKYPFLSDFYLFYLDVRKPTSSYDFIISKICMDSPYIDIVFFLQIATTLGMTRRTPTRLVCFAMRDAVGTIFVVTCKARRIPAWPHRPLSAENQQDKPIYGIPYDNLLRKDLHKNDRLCVYEKTVLITDDLFQKLEVGSISRDDVIGFFPDKAFLKRLYEAHK